MPQRYPGTLGSPGAAAMDELTQILAEREAKRRQAMLDEIMLKREARNDEIQRAQLEETQANSASRRRADDEQSDLRKASVMTPGQVVDVNPFSSEIGRLLVAENQEVAPTGDSETDGTMDVRSVFRGTPQQLQAKQKETVFRKLLENPNLSASQKSYLEAKLAAGDYDIQPAMFDTPRTQKPADVLEYEFYVGQETAEGRKPKSFAEYQSGKGGGGKGSSPYFTPQTAYDAQGRPVGTYSYNTRTGEASLLPLPIEGTTIKPPTAALGNQSILNETALDALDNLKTMYDGGASALIGPAEGRARSVGQQIPGVPVNKQFANFQAATSAFKNSVIKAITGAAMSAAEQDRIIAQIPTENDKPEVWMAKYEETVKNLMLLEHRMRKDRSSGAQPNGNDAGTVTLEGPDGSRRTVAKADAQRYIAAGAKVVK